MLSLWRYRLKVSCRHWKLMEKENQSKGSKEENEVNSSLIWWQPGVLRWQSDPWRDLSVPVFSLWPPFVCQPHLVASDRIWGLPSRCCLSQSCKSNSTVWCRFTDYLILPISACSCLYFPHYPNGQTVSLLFTAHSFVLFFSLTVPVYHRLK